MSKSELWANGKITICSSDTPISVFNIKSADLMKNKKDVINDKF